MGMGARVTIIPGVLRVYLRERYKPRYGIGPWWLRIFVGGGRKARHRRGL